METMAAGNTSFHPRPALALLLSKGNSWPQTRGTLLLTQSHFSASIWPETFTYEYPILSAGNGSVRGEKFIPCPKVNGSVLEICALCVTYVWSGSKCW